MSSISSTSAAGIVLSGSVASSVRTNLNEDRSRAASGEQKTQIDREADVTRTLEDVANAESGGERDADGRLSYRTGAHDSGSDPSETAAGPQSDERGPAADALGECGRALDIQA